MKQSKRILIIAPHGDDELNLIGTIFKSFSKNNYNIYLVVVTNGDYNPEKTRQRYQETMAVAKQMEFSNVIFLGYGDTPAFDGIHTYHTEKDEKFISPAGHSHTYGVEDEYSYLKNGCHNSYCRENVKSDLKNCIYETYADIVICVDLDEHADHRMTSLLFDEVMCELLTTTEYRPVILKKYAYAGVWFGADDYYNNPMRETILTPEEYYPYSPEQEVRVDVPRRYYPVFYKHSKLYRLCKTYSTQYVTEHFTRMINADALYFFRDSSNLALHAEVSVSSGEKKYLNDFKLIDLQRINDSKQDIIQQYDRYTWIPENTDTERKAVFLFSDPVNVREIRFYFPYEDCFRPKKLLIKIHDYSETWSCGNSTDGIFTLKQPITQVRKIEIQIIEGAKNCGISEVEIFDHISKFPWNQVPLKPFNPKKLTRKRPGSNLVPVIQKKFENIHMFVRYDLRSNGLKYYFTRIINRRKK